MGECLNKAPLPPLISGTCAETQAATIAIHPHLLDAAMACVRSAFHLGGITFRRLVDVSPEPLRVCSPRPPRRAVSLTQPARPAGSGLTVGPPSLTRPSAKPCSMPRITSCTHFCNSRHHTVPKFSNLGFRILEEVDGRRRGVARGSRSLFTTFIRELVDSLCGLPKK